VFATYLIGLREGLEAGLIVGILIAYLRKVDRTDVLPRLWIGISAAIAVSLGVGALLTWGPYGLSFQAQEILGGTLSLAAAALVTWMIFWMGAHARGLKHDLQSRLDAALAGSAAGIVLLGLMSVGREGVETALFVWANMKTSGTDAASAIGALLGILSAVVLSYLLYRGFVRINLGKFFTWTGVFLIVIVAGIVSYAIGDLQEGGLLPGGENIAYSLAGLVPPTSWYGMLLAGIFNFKPEPSWAQVIGWVGYVAIVGSLFFRQVFARRPQPTQAAPASAPRIVEHAA
jgi:high-affinity iron transporter